MTCEKRRSTSALEPVHSFVRVGGVRLHWAELGADRRHRPVVLLHGLNDSHLTWKRVGPPLATDRRVLMPDFAGYGLSERPDASYALDWHANLITGWLAALGLEQVDVVGHSFGGGVAQVMLLERPAKIRRLVLAAAGGLGREVGVALRLASFPFLVERWGQRFMAFGTRMALRGQRAGLLPGEVEEICAMNATEGSARAFARTVRDVVNWRGQRRTFFESAHQIAALPPIAVFWGDRDSMIPASHGFGFTEQVRGARLRMFEGCGHYLHCEQTGRFVEAVREFLDDNQHVEPAYRVARRMTGSSSRTMRPSLQGA